jgi:hypothetical protein
MPATLQVGSVGVDIIVPLTDNNGNPIDLTLATAMFLYFQDPEADPGTAVEKVATKVGSGKEGRILYRTVAGDLATAGDWKLQARVQFASPTRDWYSGIYPLEVAANLGPTSTAVREVA